MRARSLLCVLGFVGLLVAVPTAVAYEFFPEARNELQRDWEALFTKIFWVALVVFALVEGIILYSIIRFRKRKGGPTEGPHVHGNTKMEIAWTIAPTLVMAWLLVVSMEQMKETDTEAPNPDIEIQVIGHQFFWEFVYPDGSKPVMNTFYVEEDRVVGLHVTSTDVIHAFNIPELGVMIDATPGRMNYFWFRAEEPGEYFSQCRELCGVGHGKMHAKLVVFAAGTQDKPYGAPMNTSAPTGTTTPASTNTTSPTTGTSGTAGATGTGAPVNEVEVVLDEFSIMPTDYTAEPGTQIMFKIKNDGQQVHNLYIGPKFTSGAENNGAEWFSDDVAGGQSGSFDVQLPATPGYWEWWCNIGGHYESGMRGTLSTGGDAPTGDRPLLPGFELTFVIVAALGVAFFAARRRD